MRKAHGCNTVGGRGAIIIRVWVTHMSIMVGVS